MIRYSLLIIFLVSFVSSAQQIVPAKMWELIASGFDFPEGPAWNYANTLYLSSCNDHRIIKITDYVATDFLADSSAPVSFQKTNGLTFGKDGFLYACDYGLGHILLITESGYTKSYADGYNDEAFNRPNDLAFAPNGDLYFTDPKSYGKDKPDGRIFRVDNSTKEVVLLAEGLCFPNGIAFSDDGEFLYVCESAQERILKYPVHYDSLRGNYLGDYEVFAETPGGDPDGIAFDITGALYVAHFGGSAILIINQEGKIVQKIETPGSKPSNIEFAGTNLEMMYITEDETNCVYKMRNTIPGLKLFYKPE